MEESQYGYKILKLFQQLWFVVLKQRQWKCSIVWKYRWLKCKMRIYIECFEMYALILLFFLKEKQGDLLNNSKFFQNVLITEKKNHGGFRGIMLTSFPRKKWSIAGSLKNRKQRYLHDFALWPSICTWSCCMVTASSKTNTWTYHDNCSQNLSYQLEIRLNVNKEIK